MWDTIQDRCDPFDVITFDGRKAKIFNKQNDHRLYTEEDKIGI